MFSTLSTATDEDAYRAALIDVVDQSFFALAELCPFAEVEDEIEACDRWLRASMSFSSDTEHGTMTLALPSVLATDLAAAFSGAEPTELSPDQVADLTGELCNMVCGLWLTRSCPNDRFHLQPPDVAEPAGMSWSSIASYARVNGFPVVLEATRRIR